VKQVPPDERKLLVRQIEVYSPHIVIGGSTLHLLKNDLGITDDHNLDFGHFQKDGKLFLDTYHPAQLRKKTAWYVDKIMERAKQWRHIYQGAAIA
jgi:hypothetical protein